MRHARVMALRRLVDEHSAGLARVNDDDLFRLIDELLDELEFISSVATAAGLGEAIALAREVLAMR